MPTTSNNDPEIKKIEVSEPQPEKITLHLEEKYPLLDRRDKGWKLVGFIDTKNNRPRPTLQNPYGVVPHYYYLGWDRNSKYTGEKLRQLRKERGVGNVKNIQKA